MKKILISLFSVLAFNVSLYNVTFAQANNTGAVAEQSSAIQTVDAVVPADDGLINANSLAVAPFVSTTTTESSSNKAIWIWSIVVVVLVLILIAYLTRTLWLPLFKKVAMKQAIKSQMKGVPENQQNMMMSAVEKNPQFFENIAKEIEQKVKEGKSKTAASMEVMRKHQDELRRLMM